MIFNLLKEKFDFVQKNDLIKTAKNLSNKDNIDIKVTNEENKTRIEYNLKISNNSSSNPNFSVDSEDFNLIKDLPEDKNENPFKFSNNNNLNNNNLDNKKNNNPFKPEVKNEKESLLTFGMKNIQENKNQIQIQINNDIVNLNNPYLNCNRKSCQFLISIKTGGKLIKIFDPTLKKIFSYELKSSMFKDSSISLENFNVNSRFINLGSSILITGGITLGSIPVCSSFLLTITKNSNQLDFYDKFFNISIIAYSPIKEARERHCMLDIHDKNKVLVCSGFLKNSVEITNLNTGSWKTLNNLTEVRANATPAYVNNRYAWIFGGFKIAEGKGVYTNSAEVLDLNDENSKWKFIDFETKFKHNIKFNAAGVINYSTDKLLLCGGYNGKVYINEVYCVEFSEMNLVAFDKTKLVMPDELIFFHGSFERCLGSAVNFDYKNELNVYNPLTKEFKIYK